MIFQFSGKNAVISDENPEEATFNPKNFTVSQAVNSRDYNVALSRWEDGNFMVWNRLIPQQNDEDLVIAFAEESLNRSVYSSAVSAINRSFSNGSYKSSVFLGQLDQAYRSMTTEDQETLNRLSSLIRGNSTDFLLESGAFDFLNSRGQTGLSDDALKLVSSLSTEAVTLDLVPGILEGYLYWSSLDLNGVNPFAHLIDQSIAKISECLYISQDKNRVFEVSDNSINTILNIRLAEELSEWAGSRQDDTWGGVARSIILSVLGLENFTGTIRGEYLLSPEGDITENQASASLSTGLIYTMLHLGTYEPKALALGAGPNPAWIWTAGQDVKASMNGTILDISMTFPVGETHYLILRGIRPFSKIQLYNMDYRSDPQFERYDSSGWTYRAADQTLLVKMKHKTQEEHIKIYF